MQNSVLGVFVALVGNSLIGCSFSVMKVAHERNKGGGSYLKVPLWWMGTILMIFGELGNLIAYSLAKPSLISPLGAISVLVNVPAAYITLGERPSASNMIGCVMCVVGGYGIVGVVAGNTRDRPPMTVAEFEDLAFRPPFMVFFVLSVAESASLIWSGRRTVLGYITICSLLGGLTVLSIKAVSSFILLTMQGQNQFVSLFPFVLLPVLAVTCLLQVQYLNKALAHFGTAEVVPIYYVIFTSAAVFGSAVLYGDLDEMPLDHIAIFLGSCAATSVGVYLVARKGAAGAQQHASGYPASDALDGEFGFDDDEEEMMLAR